jgi:hypothetical protein
MPHKQFLAKIVNGGLKNAKECKFGEPKLNN